MYAEFLPDSLNQWVCYKNDYCSKDLEKHMWATWKVRIKQTEAILKMSSEYEELLEFLKKDKYVW